MVMEYCVYDLISPLNHNRFTEQQIVEAITHTCRGLLFLHNVGICHRDIKPGNILYHDSSQTWKISHFELSCTFNPKEPLITGCLGTPHYMAPEMFPKQLTMNSESAIYGESTYTQAVDMWAVGITAYYALSLKYPFDSDTEYTLRELIISGKYEFTPQFNSNSSEDARNFIRSLLKPENERSSAYIALHDYWLYF